MHVSKEDLKQSALNIFKDTDMEENTIDVITQIIKSRLYHFERAFDSSQVNLSQEEVIVVPSENQITKETATTVRIILETEINPKEIRCSEDLQYSKCLC